MKVEPFGYPLENALVQKLDLMIARCIQKNPKRDAVLICEGAEGEGKSTYAVAISYYVRWKTQREFSHKNVFFDLKKMIEFLQTTESQIAIWDEPALQALSKDALTAIVKDLERLLMMARKKRHFIIINMAYFNKFSDYIVWQRPLGMIHVYSRNEIEPGRFVYIRKKQLEGLWNEWRTKRTRNYKKFCAKNIHGTFPDVLNPEYDKNVLSEFDVNAYEREKDRAIMMIGKKESPKESHQMKTFKQMKLKLADLSFPILTRQNFAEQLQVAPQTIRRWRNIEVDDG